MIVRMRTGPLPEFGYLAEEFVEEAGSEGAGAGEIEGQAGLPVAGLDGVRQMGRESRRAVAGHERSALQKFVDRDNHRVVSIRGGQSFAEHPRRLLGPDPSIAPRTGR